MKNFLTNQEFQLDEVLFAHRNQNYGAYVLRHEADKTLTKAMFAGIFLFVALSATPFILNSFKTVEVIHKDDGRVRQITDIIDPVITPPVVHVQPITPQVATTVLSIPVPKKNVTVETPATTLRSTDNKNIGLVEIKGTPPTMSVSPPANVIPPSASGPITVPEDNTAKTHVDIEAKFSKGIEGFRNGMIQNFDATNFDGVDNIMKTTITFIVEKDGSISDIKADGANKDFNQQAIIALKSIRGKWTPAKLKGETVRSYFTFPISMKFE